jgi:hypothetical protein
MVQPCLLLIPQSFDWLAAFHLDLLQAIFSLLYNCQLLCTWRLALSIAVEVFPRPFSGYCSFRDAY